MDSQIITSLSQLQKKWIRTSFEDIKESPESYGLSSVKDTEEIVSILKEDLDSNFQVESSLEEVTKFIKSLQDAESD